MSFFRGLWRSNSKHKKLCEEWALANSCESFGPSTSSGSCSTTSASTSASASASSSRTGPEDTEAAPETLFTLKYLGSTLVESPSSEKETADAIKTIIGMTKASGKKLQRISLAVSIRGIRMMDLTTEEEELEVSIYSISYCSADAAHDHVFAFIATNPNETMECHAYLCPKRKVAHTVTLTVAQAFNAAFELWQLSQLESPRDEGAEEKNDSDKSSSEEEESKSRASQRKKSDSQKDLLIDVQKDTKVVAKVESWVSFDEDALQTADEQGSRPLNEGIPLKPLRSPTGPPASTVDEPSPTKPATEERPTQPKHRQGAWALQARQETCAVPLDLVCSSWRFQDVPLITGLWKQLSSSQKPSPTPAGGLSRP